MNQPPFPRPGQPNMPGQQPGGPAPGQRPNQPYFDGEYPTMQAPPPHYPQQQPTPPPAQYPPQRGPQPGYAPSPGYPAQPGYAAQPNYAAQPGYPPAPGYPHQPGPQLAGKRLIVGPLLMIIGAIVTVVSMFLPWNYDIEWTTGQGGVSMSRGEAINVFTQIVWNVEAGRPYGYLQLAAVVLAFVAVAIVVIVAIMAMTSPRPSKKLGGVAIAAGILGMVATLGVFSGYAVLGALGEAAYGMYIYAVAFIPAMIGAVGVKSWKF